MEENKEEPSEHEEQSAPHVLGDVCERLSKVARELNVDVSSEIESLRTKLNASRPVEVEDELTSSLGLVSTKEFKCSLCFDLLVEPVTIACGHTYCRFCLTNALSISSKKCPQCRAPCHVDPLSQNENILVANLLKEHFGELYTSRLLQIQPLLASLNRRLPVFFMSQVYFPYSQMRFHFFEPRYQVMIRRALEGGRVFGYIAKNRPGGIDAGDVGVFAHIAECEFFADGRSLVEVVFGKRFQVNSSWVEDGTFGLWYCDHGVLEDDVLETEAFLSNETKTQFDALCGDVEGIRSRGANASNYPRTDFTNEPPTPNWPADGTNIAEMTNEFSAWTLWCCGLIQNEHRVAVSTEEAMLGTTNAVDRLSILAACINPSQSSALSSLGALFGNRQVGQGANAAAPARLWQLLQAHADSIRTDRSGNSDGSDG